MSGLRFTVKSGDIAACPSCGNESEFIAHSGRVAEDCCELWIECKCGTAPPSDYRREDVWGGVDKDDLPFLVRDWNEWVRK